MANLGRYDRPVPDVAFVMSARQPYPLRELAATLEHELALQAVPSALHLGRFPAHRPDRVYILLDPRGYTEIEGEQALPGDPILKRTIFLCAERPPADGDDAHLDLLRRAGAVFVLDQRAVVAMHRLGIPARLMRPGYSTALDHFDPEAERAIDVMFLGAHSLRRTRYLSRAARVLARHNCLLQISDDAPAAGDTSSFLGAGRWPLLARTKILINLHRDEDTRFEWRGALDAIHAGAVVVTEHASGISPLVAGEHLLVAGADSLPFVVEALLRDEERLARLRAAAYERLSTWIPYALPVSVLRAAIVELVGEPVPEGTSLGRPACGDGREVPGGGGVAPGDGGVAPGDGGVAPGDGGRERVAIIHRTAAWAARRAPRLTVLTVAGGGDGGGLVATLDSLAHSRMPDFELVVIDRGDGAGDAARGWLAGHPRVAALQVAVSGKPGRGGSRNVGLDFARGPLCLVLDSGQELYPRCLEVLAGTLEAMPEMAFAYPIQEVTGSPDGFVEAGGDYLMSFLGWDSGRLRRGADIHAPALIRTDRLRGLGGWASDRRLDGIEDYDLWCRMAERGWRGQVVPQELARRRESGSSAVLRAIHPTAGPATAALARRSPRLMAGAFPAP